MTGEETEAQSRREGVSHPTATVINEGDGSALSGGRLLRVPPWAWPGRPTLTRGHLPLPGGGGDPGFPPIPPGWPRPHCQRNVVLTPLWAPCPARPRPHCQGNVALSQGLFILTQSPSANRPAGRPRSGRRPPRTRWESDYSWKSGLRHVPELQWGWFTIASLCGWPEWYLRREEGRGRGGRGWRRQRGKGCGGGGERGEDQGGGGAGCGWRERRGRREGASQEPPPPCRL